MELSKDVLSDVNALEARRTAPLDKDVLTAENRLGRGSEDITLIREDAIDGKVVAQCSARRILLSEPRQQRRFSISGVQQCR